MSVQTPVSFSLCRGMCMCVQHQQFIAPTKYVHLRTAKLRLYGRFTTCMERRRGIIRRVKRLGETRSTVSYNSRAGYM